MQRLALMRQQNFQVQMGINSSRKSHQQTPITAADLFPNGPGSAAGRLGRRVQLTFTGEAVPVLHRIEYRPSQKADAEFLQINHPLKWFTWTEVPQALSLLFVDYLIWDQAGRPGEFYFTGACDGSLAAALGNAIYTASPIHELFLGAENASKSHRSHLRQIFYGGDNVHGRATVPRDRRITINLQFLPPDCVEVVWPPRRDGPLQKIQDLTDLADRIRASLGLPPTPKPKPVDPAPKSAPVPTASENQTPKTNPASPPQTPRPKPPPPPEEKTIPLIDPRLLFVPEEKPLWPDELPLMDFGEECPVWTLSDAFAGVLILGATNSGKTSGSGDALASTFLQAGFGGLVLTVKKDEADHWRRLCADNGRSGDLIVIGADGKWKFNILAYQAQRPGRGGGLAKNLVTFCRNLLKLSARGSRGGGTNEEFWTTATDQLFEALFELFLLARQPLSFDRLSKFVMTAPTSPDATHDSQLPTTLFGRVFRAAEVSLSSDEDKRLFDQVRDYWFSIFPTMPTKIRTTIVLGVTAMFDAFRGRDIPGVISAETNATPEMALRGKIIVVDFPIKEYEQAGLLIQSAIKYVFQTAFERQASARNASRRPVFLFEDEASHFVSEHDKHFQATARSARVCRVVITQNVNSFYSEFGSAITNTIFGNLNTKIFHQNSDYDSNLYASRIFGNEIVLRSSMSVNPPKQANDIVGQLYQTYLPESSVSHSESEQLEPAVPPEDFNQLRNGGERNNFQVEAYITWLGMADGGGRHFTKTTFLQKAPEQSYERKRPHPILKFLRKIIGSV